MKHKPERWGAAAFTVRTGNADPFVIAVEGRDRWALEALMQAGATGCTPIDYPGPRWSAYVFKLRELGVGIETRHEAHPEPFAGNHARYILRSTVTPAQNAGRGVAA